jgi:hypothetical protein
MKYLSIILQKEEIIILKVVIYITARESSIWIKKT